MAEEFFDAVAEQLRQGDIFQGMRFLWAESAGEPGTLSARWTTVVCPALLLNQSCDIDKGSERLIVIPVVPLSTLPSQQQTNVRKNKLLSRLFLPSYRDLLPESFASFVQPMTVGRDFLEATARLASLSERGRRALYLQYIRWVSRWRFNLVSCPTCGTGFDPGQTLPIVND